MTLPFSRSRRCGESLIDSSIVWIAEVWMRAKDRTGKAIKNKMKKVFIGPP
jgi:hypothetical protein